MPNYCKTFYRLEGPEKEILCVAEHMRNAIYGNPQVNAARAEEYGEEARKWLEEHPKYNIYTVYEPLGSSRNVRYILKEMGIDCRPELCIISSDIIDDDIRKAPDGKLVLHFDTISKWEPDHDIIQSMIDKWAPNSRYYYLSEEFGFGVHETNDVSRYYFPADYAVRAGRRLEDGTLASFDSIFTSATCYSEVIDQVGYYSYWGAEDLKDVMGEYIHDKTLSVTQTIEQFLKLFYEDPKTKDCYVDVHQITRVNDEDVDDSKESLSQEERCRAMEKYWREYEKNRLDLNYFFELGRQRAREMREKKESHEEEND